MEQKSIPELAEMIEQIIDNKYFGNIEEQEADNKIQVILGFIIEKAMQGQ